jgi:hypothetical protein
MKFLCLTFFILTQIIFANEEIQEIFDGLKGNQLCLALDFLPLADYQNFF